MSSVSFSPDGLHALSGGENIRMWDVASGKCLRTFEGHTGGVSSVAFSPDGRFALSGSGDKTLRLWEIVFAKQQVPLVASILSASSSAQFFRLLQQAQGSLTSQAAVAAGFLQQARQQPGCSRREDALELARKLSHALAHRCFVGGWVKRTFECHTNSVYSMSFSPDGRFALWEGSDRPLGLWELSKGECLRTFEGHTSEVNSVSWSPDGRFGSRCGRQDAATVGGGQRKMPAHLRDT